VEQNWCYCRAMTSFRFDITAWITLTQFSALFSRSLPKLVCERANTTIVATASNDQRTGRVGWHACGARHVQIFLQ
jgi:hypothetical protein